MNNCLILPVKFASLFFKKQKHALSFEKQNKIKNKKKLNVCRFKVKKKKKTKAHRYLFIHFRNNIINVFLFFLNMTINY